MNWLKSKALAWLIKNLGTGAAESIIKAIRAARHESGSAD